MVSRETSRDLLLGDESEETAEGPQHVRHVAARTRDVTDDVASGAAARLVCALRGTWWEQRAGHLHSVSPCQNGIFRSKIYSICQFGLQGVIFNILLCIPSPDFILITAFSLGSDASHPLSG